jgi:hypothetical protein
MNKNRYLAMILLATFAWLLVWGVSGSGLEVKGAESFEQILRDTCADFFTLVHDEVNRHSEAADTVVEEGSKNCGSLFFGQCHELDVLSECASDAQDEFLSICQSFEGPK